MGEDASAPAGAGAPVLDCLRFDLLRVPDLTVLGLLLDDDTLGDGAGAGSSAPAGAGAPVLDAC